MLLLHSFGLRELEGPYLSNYCHNAAFIMSNKAYFKLLDGSQTLLAILKRDEASLEQKMGENDN